MDRGSCFTRSADPLRSVAAANMAYAMEKRFSRTPEKFGKGHLPGLAAPESANNAASQTGFIPTLTLGVPGDAVMALIIGALILNGIVPGPRLMVDQPELFSNLDAFFDMEADRAYFLRRHNLIGSPVLPDFEKLTRLQDAWGSESGCSGTMGSCWRVRFLGWSGSMR